MSRGTSQILGIALAGAALGFLVSRGATGPRRRSAGHAPHTGTTLLASRDATFTVHPGMARVTVRSVDGAFSRDVDFFLVVDGNVVPLELARANLRFETDTVATGFPVAIDGGTVQASLTLHVDRDSDALIAVLSVPTIATASNHTLALRAETPTEGRGAFVSGTGELADLGSVSGRLAVIPAEPFALGLVSSRGVLDVGAVSDEADVGSPMRIAVTSPLFRLDPSLRGVTDLRLALSPSTAKIWGTLFQLSGEVTARVTGVVKGYENVPARVYGLDGEGMPIVRADADAAGRFTLEVPKSVSLWYASLDASRTSAPTGFVPGSPYELRLDVSPGGEIVVRVIDADSGQPLTARLYVHGIDGALDPSFGPDYRASGAGPLMDALRGAVTTPVPAGHYRVSATKGFEWSIDEKTVDVEPGRSVTVELAPRHVVPTRGMVGCDLHVHARPSFDTPVQPEDRVLSLVAAGVDFAVPSEHNIVGDYTPALSTLDLAHELAFVSGVEVTTYNPRFGHFGVFPYPRIAVPPYRRTSIGSLFAAAHRGDPSRILQVNHPRLPKAIGYFEIFKFDPDAPHPPSSMRTDFDTLEVYNGFEQAHPERVDVVMRDWFSLLNQGYRYAATGSSDSHRIQFQWAGYPRTMAEVGEVAAGDRGGSIDTAAVVAAVKRGHSTVTSGPVLSVEVEGMRPGDEVVTGADPVHAHVVVRAAPWVDVTSLEVIANGSSLETMPIPSRPTKTGPEPGSLDEAAARTIRLDQQLTLSLGTGNTWLVFVARGQRRLDDVLPFMPTPPLAFSNPIWITRDPSAWPKPVLPRPARGPR